MLPHLSACLTFVCHNIYVSYADLPYIDVSSVCLPSDPFFGIGLTSLLWYKGTLEAQSQNKEAERRSWLHWR